MSSLPDRQTQRHGALPGPTLGGIANLLDALAHRDITLPGCDDFATRTAWLSTPRPLPTWPTDILTLDRDAVDNLVRDLTLANIVNQGEAIGHVVGAYGKAMCDAAAATIREHANTIIDALNVELSSLLAKAVALRAAGVSHDSTAADVIRMHADTIKLWNEFEALAPQLDTLAELRFALTSIALVAPGSTHAQASDTLWGACFTAQVEYDRPNEAPHARWLRLASIDGLAFSKPEALTTLDQLAADVPHLDVDRLHAIANRRLTTTESR